MTKNNKFINLIKLNLKMKKFLFAVLLCSWTFIQAQIANDTVFKSFNIEEVTITSLYQSSNANKIDSKEITSINNGQEPSHVFSKLPSIFSFGDNGTEYGYGYYRIRGLDQTRINVTLDGMPWNEAEDFGTYFANSPDIMSSLHSIKIENGSSSKVNGIAASAGAIILESVDLKNDTVSHADLVYGSFNTYKASIVYNMGLKKGFGFHLKATQSGTNGYRDNSFNRSHALTAKLGYYFNDRHSIDILSMNGYHTNGQGWVGSTKQELLNNPKNNGDTKDETDNWIQSINKLQYKGKIGENMLLIASAYLQYQTGSYRMDLDNWQRKMCDSASYYEYGKKLLYDYGLTHYLYGGNVVFKAYDIKNLFDITAGINAYGFQREHFMDDRNKKYFKNINKNEYYDNIGYKTDVNAYIAMDFHPYKGLTIGYNLNYRFVNFAYKDLIEKEFVSSRDLNTTWDFINGGANINYEFEKYHNIYAKFAVSNREPTRSDMFGGSEIIPRDTITNKPSINNIKPELVYDIEIGYGINHKKITANINGFFMFFKNELILTNETGPNGLPLHKNANSSYRGGIELSVDYHPIQGFHIINNTSWSHNKIKYNGIVKNHVLTPDWTEFIEINNTFNNIVTIGVNYKMYSSLYIDLENENKVPINMTLNAYASVRPYKFMDISVMFNNITNRTNYYNCAIGAENEKYWFQEAKFNISGSIKFYF